MAFFTQNKNDLTFKIRYSPRVQAVYAALKEQIADVPDVEVSQSPKHVTLTFTNEILFQSGSAKISKLGISVIQQVASHFQSQEEFAVVVVGHTDDVPILGKLQNRYASNWELSADRSLKVLHALADAGVQPSQLQAHAMGQYQPRVANDSDENKRANRRTEIRIEPL